MLRNIISVASPTSSHIHDVIAKSISYSRLCSCSLTTGPRALVGHVVSTNPNYSGIKTSNYLNVIPSLATSSSFQISLFRTRNQTISMQQFRHFSKSPISRDAITNAPSNLKWDIAEELVKPESVLTSPIIGFTKLNFIQELFYPYSFLIMHYMDFLLNYLPWWSTIMLTTLTVRLLFFPLYVKQHKVGIKSFNLLPQTQVIQAKMNTALASGDSIEAAVERSKLMALEKSHGLTLWKKIGPTLIQAPMFVSMFFLLRRYSGDLGIEALQTGGAFWFANLTLPDPFYILPAITSLSTLLLFELGAEGSMTPSMAMTPALRWTLRLFPCILFYITSSFPAAILLFWSTNNSITLAQSLLIRNPWLSKKLGVPMRLDHDPKSLPLAGQSFTKQWKTARDTAKAKNTTYDIRRLDDIAFRKAGIGPIQKTYKEPPKLSK